MKKILTTLTLLLTLCSFSYGQDDSYFKDYYEGYDSYDAYEKYLIGLGDNCSVISVIYIDGEIQTTANIEVALFFEDELRGSVKNYEYYEGIPHYFRFIGLYFDSYSDEPDYGTVTIKGYNHDTKEILTSTTTFDIPRQRLGSVKDPFKIYFESSSVAKIGDARFQTLAVAVEAAQEGETITLIKDTEEESVTVDKDITLALGDKTFKGVLDLKATLNIENTTGTVTSIKLNEGAQVYNNNELTTTIKKDIAGYGTGLGWHTISSPVGNITVSDVVNMTSNSYDLFRFNEVSMMWENSKQAEGSTNFTNIEAGRGYLYANSNDVELGFAGTLLADDVTYTLSKTEGNSLEGFNLVGNPFAHNISMAHFSGAELAAGYYVLTNSGAWEPVLSSNGVLMPCQGALIKTTSAHGTEMTISKTAATETRSASNGALEIVVENADYSDVAYVTFDEGIGLNKIAHQNAEIPMVYIPMEGEKYAVVSMNNEVTEIPVSFKVKTIGEYTLSINARDCELENVILKDRLTGIETNMLLEDYTFNATSKDNADRFVICSATTEPESVTEHYAFMNNGNIIINNVEGEASVTIFDIMGRPVVEQTIFGSANISTESLDNGIYFIQLLDKNGVKVQKIVVE